MGNATLLVVSYFAALLLNFGDFSRFAKSERQMKVGNFLGLPVNFVLYSIVVVIVTAGSAKVFGAMDPKDTPGTRGSVDACELKLELEA